jgi:general secretion pathway protein F
MPSFDYQALSAAGKKVSGQLIADSAFAARAQLRQQGLTPLAIQPIQTADQRSSRWSVSWLRSRLTLKELVLLTRQLATLLEGGLPLAQVLSILSAQSESQRLSRLLIHLHAKVQEGHSLAQAMTSAPYQLPEDVIAMIAAGETSGNLLAVISRLADAIETREQVTAQMKGAMFYPLLMLVLSLGIVVFLLAVVVPKVVVMFSHMKQELPPLTQGLIATSHWLVQWWPALIMLVLMLVVLARYLLSRPRITMAWHRLLLKLPVFGKLMQDGATARWSRTLAVLLKSGVPAVDALRISAQVVGVLPMQAAVEHMAVQVREGVPLHRALTQAHGFPSLLRYLVESGEASGQLPTMLARAAQHYEVSAQTLSTSLAKLIEPMLILFMGAVVLFIVIAILLPIFAMNQLVG